MKHFLPALLLVAVAAGADEPQAPLPPVTSPPSVTGQSPAAPTRESSRLRAEIRSVIDSDEFHERKTVTTPVLRDWLRDITARWRTPSRGTPGKISTAIDFNLLARLFKYGEAILLVAAVAWLLWKGRQWLPSRLSRRTDPKNFPLPPDSHSTAMAASDLPTRVSAAARAAWASGDATTALSLLYR
ncbi:MAG TPA: hypothetical protein VFM34_01820, partial [Moraxellaceae bacterium]|nr:hypothetical protein [Moraxellaceae bacterium]